MCPENDVAICTRLFLFAGPGLPYPTFQLNGTDLGAPLLFPGCYLGSRELLGLVSNLDVLERLRRRVRARKRRDRI